MSSLPPALSWKVTASMDIVTAMFEARYPGEWTFADFAGGVTLQGGYKNEDGSVEIVNIFTSGIIDAVRVIHAPTGPVTEVKGRDAGYTLTDNIALIQFLSQDALRSPVLPLLAPLHGGIDIAAAHGLLPPPPAGWSRVVAISAHQCCAAVLGGVGGLLFGTWDYPIIASFVSRGHKIDALRTLLGPQSLLEVSRPYIWHRHDGVFVVAPLGSGAAADWDLDASEWLLSGDVTISEQPGPKYAHWLLTGGPDVSFIADVYEANSQPTTSVVFGYDANGILVSSSTSVAVGRKEDGAVLAAIRFTWGPDPDDPAASMVELSFESTEYKWEDPIIGSRFQLLNRPVLLRQSTFHQTRTAIADHFELRPSAISRTGYDYDVFKVSTGSATLTVELDPETGTTVRVALSAESLNRVLNMTLRTLLSPDAVGSQAFISGGLPAGGAGSNAQLPACLREGSVGVGWTDVELGNGNLSNADLDQMVARIAAESGQIKGEVTFEIAALPQLHLGDLATIRDLPLPDGSLRTFRGQVAGLVSSNSPTGGLVQALTLRYWRAA